MKSGETPFGAAARETEEELGLKVMIGALVAEVSYLGVPQYYFLADSISGQFGTGDGSEMKSLTDSEKGSYHPLWMAMDEIQNIPLLPKIMAEYIMQSYKEGWRENPLKAVDDSPDDLVAD